MSNQRTQQQPQPNGQGGNTGYLELDSSHDAGPLDFGRRASVIDDDKYLGQQVPKRLSNGPVRSRRATDIICCIIFALFLVAWIALGVYYTLQPNKMTSMTEILDSEGNYCGIDAKVKDYPYLYMIKFDADYRSVCVKQCLKFDYNQIKYNSDGTNTSTITPLYYEDLPAAAKEMNPDTLSSKTDENSFKYDSKFANGYYTESQWNAYVNRLSLDCVTNDDVKSCKNNPADKVYLYDSRASIMNFCNPVQPKLAGSASSIPKFNISWILDIITAKWMILISIAVAFICALVFLLISRIFMDVIIWIQLAVAILFMLMLTIMLYYFTFADMTSMLRDNGATPETMNKYFTAKKYKVVFCDPVVVLRLRHYFIYPHSRPHPLRGL